MLQAEFNTMKQQGTTNPFDNVQFVRSMIKQSVKCISF